MAASLNQENRDSVNEAQFTLTIEESTDLFEAKLNRNKAVISN